MTPDEIKVASAMSNMEYRSISQIATISQLSSNQVRNIVYSFFARRLVESQVRGLKPYYRLK